MLSYFNRFIGPPAGTIGLDFGGRVLKAVQVCRGDGGLEVAAAAALAVPVGVWEDMAAMTAFFRGPVRRLLASGGFRGRRVVIALPAREMHACSTRRGELGGGAASADTGDDVTARWLPFPSAHAVLRHVEAGDVYADGSLRREVVTLAVRREVVDRCLRAAASANLQVVAVAAEPDALLRALSHAYGPEAQVMRLVVDLGYEGARIYAGIRRRLMFARCVGYGSRQFEQTVAAAVGVAPDAAGDLVAGLPPLEAEPHRPRDGRQRRANEACDGAVKGLSAELRLCHQYLAATFPATPVHHMVFVGGGARNRRICQRLAEAVGLPFRAADPASRMPRAAAAAAALQERGTDTAVAGPAWSAALGLSLAASAAGPVGAESSADPGGIGFDIVRAAV